LHHYNTLLKSNQLEHTLTMLANGDIDITFGAEDREQTGNKCKCKSTKAATWKIEQPNDTIQPFSDAHWGGATHKFMLLLSRVPHNAMANIICEAQLITTGHKAKPKANMQGSSERAALTFH
jgi:hypothetical protein